MIETAALPAFSGEKSVRNTDIDPDPVDEVRDKAKDGMYIRTQATKGAK